MTFVKKALLERFILRASKATKMYIFILNPVHKLLFHINNQWEQGTSLVVAFEEEALEAKCKNLK